MAEPEYIAILEQGIDAWNLWRSEHARLTIDLRGADLSGTDLSFADFLEVDFTGADLSGVNLRKANLSTANLSNANLNGSFMGEVDLSGANLFEATLHGCYLRGAYLFGADFTHADLSESDLSECHLRQSHLSKANLLSANLFGSNLYCADLGGANLSQCDLSICNLTRANLYGADLNEANLRGSDLTRANLMRANLFKANLSSATLIRAQLSRSYLGGVDLSHADLRYADLSYADLTGVNLLEADLRYADVSYADLMKSYISGTQAVGTNFTATQFTGVCLEDWDIDSDTRLNDVECHYIYLKSKVERPQGIITRTYEERYPPDSKFKPGEFIRLFQKTMGIVSMVFQNGMDWEAFSQTFKNIDEEHAEAKFSIYSIKNKGNGTVVIKAIVSSDVDRSRIHDEFMLSYELLRKALDEQYQARADQEWLEIVGFSREHVSQREYINSLFYALNRLNSVQRAATDSPEYEKQRRTLIDFVEQEQRPIPQAEVTILQPDLGESLSPIVEEIKQILDTLLTSYTEQTEAERMSQISRAVSLVQGNRAFKNSLVTTLRDGGNDTIEDLLDHPLMHILIDALEN